MSEYVVMPAADWRRICDTTRSKTGTTDLFKSGEVAEALEGNQTGGGEDLFVSVVEGTIKNLESDSITKVKGMCFRYDSILNSVNLPNCTAIGMESFQNATNLKKALLPKVKTISSSAFNGCKALDEVYLPVCESIGLQTFANCSALTSIDFPNLKQWTYSGTFGNCTALATFIIRNKTNVVPLPNTNCFSGTPIASGTGYIYVPRALLNDSDVTKDYRRATNWATYADQFRAIEDYPEICGEVSA